MLGSLAPRITESPRVVSLKSPIIALKVYAVMPTCAYSTHLCILQQDWALRGKLLREARDTKRGAGKRPAAPPSPARPPTAYLAEEGEGLKLSGILYESAFMAIEGATCDEDLPASLPSLAEAADLPSLLSIQGCGSLTQPSLSVTR